MQTNIFSSLNISATALSVQRRRMESISRNLANIDTTRSEKGGPYRREFVVVREKKQHRKFHTILNRFHSRLNKTHYKHLINSFYNRKDTVPSGGVEIERISKDDSSPKMKFDPQHPDADENGYVYIPNINVITEMVDMINTTRAYEANLTVIDATKNIFKKSLEI